MRLSRHFVENWQKRVGGMPTAKTVQSIIKGSVVVQRGKRVATPPIYYPGMQHTHTLSIYWQPRLDLIISVDPFSQTAVSVLSKENMPSPSKRPDRGRGNCL